MKELKWEQSLLKTFALSVLGIMEVLGALSIAVMLAAFLVRGVIASVASMQRLMH